MRLVVISVLLVLFSLLSSAAREPEREEAPRDIEVLFRGFFQQFIQLSPETGVALGLTPQMGIPVDRSRLDDRSPALTDRFFELFRRTRRWMASFPPDTLTASQKRDAAILGWYLDHQIEGERFRHHAYVINPMFGFHNALIGHLTEQHVLRDGGDVRDYLDKLEQLPTRLQQVTGYIRLQESREIRPPSYVIERAMASIEEFLKVPVEESVLVTHLAEKLELMEALAPEVRTRHLAQARTRVREGVYPAYRRVLEVMRESLDRCDQRAGVWKLPDGDEYYRWCLRKHTTTRMKPDEIHRLGLQEVARIQAEVRRLLKGLGIEAEGDHAALVRRYWAWRKQQPDTDRFFYPQEATEPEQVVADYQAIIDRTWPRLETVFSQVPEARVEARPVPEYKQATSTASYEPPTLDGRRPGVFFVNPGYLPARSSMYALTFHEAVPGHHFQIALARELPENRLFKTLFFFTGFGEGWAMYAERLALEQGWHPDVHAEIAAHGSQLFRAVRLVLDTGLHHRRWSKQRALDYMQANLGWQSSGEIDRYIVWPGQACSYYLGELRLLELRDRMREAWGDAFDLREFHRLVLEEGTVPLELLEAKLEKRLADRAGMAASAAQ